MVSAWAARAFESIVCVLAMRDGFVSPTINLEHAAPGCDLDCVPLVGRAVDVDVAMSTAFGFGGHNACLVFRHTSEWHHGHPEGPVVIRWAMRRVFTHITMHRTFGATFRRHTMIRSRRRLSLGTAAMAGTVLILAACGSTTTTTDSKSAGTPAAVPAAPTAAIQNLTGAGTKVDIDPATAAILQQNGVTVTPVAPATAAMVNGTIEVSFPITSGYAAIYPSNDLPFVRGLISHSGGLTFSAGGKSLTATDFVVNPGTSTLTATVGGAGVPLLDLNGSKVAVTTDASGNVHLDGTVASLSQTAASALNSTFGVSLFKQGIVVGVVHITATGTADPGRVATAQVEQLSGTSTTVDVNASTAAVLQQNGVTVTPVAPATASTSGGGLSVTFPITNGYVAVYPQSSLPFIRGLLSHSGGLTFSAGGKSLTVTDFMVNPGNSELYATVGGSGAVVPLLDLQGSKVQMTTDSMGNIHLDGTVAVLSATAASALNSTFGVTLFKQGIPLGVVHIIATAAAK
ncbi:MAG: hypothetical protein M3R48_05700 [Candidatus Dormibacteraeota bacterium]|nr:hypothetical protein [Candidatus Dormibacteraeota bacterium]